jgi:recombination protein RecR
LYAGPVQALIDELGRMPGVGPKSAQRIAFYLLKLPKEDAQRLAHAINEVKERISFCTRCFNIAEGELCGLCLDERRDPTLVCVVEEPRDIVAVEKTQEFRGRYHVLQGAINPIEGVGPEQLRVKELLARLDAEGIVEVILCTNPNIEGEATAMYLARLLKPLGLKVTRIASGLPVGGDLEYADELTLGRALEGRREVEAEATASASLRHVAAHAHQHADHLLDELLGAGAGVVVDDVLLGDERGEVVQQGRLVVLHEQVVGVVVVVEDDAAVLVEAAARL